MALYELDGVAPRLADASHPPADLFPQEVFLEVSQCASGWIPFADLG